LFEPTVRGTAVQEEQNRVAAIIPFDGDPLIDASNADKHFLLDRLWRTESHRLKRIL
jgi:hypothetical protein